MNPHQNFQYTPTQISKGKDNNIMKSAPPAQYKFKQMSTIVEDQNQSIIDYSHIRRSKQAEQSNGNPNSHRQSKRRLQKSSKISNQKQVGHPSEINNINSKILVDFQDNQFQMQKDGYRQMNSQVTLTAPQKNKKMQIENQLRMTHVQFDKKRIDLLPISSFSNQQKNHQIFSNFANRERIGDPINQTNRFLNSSKDSQFSPKLHEDQKSKFSPKIYEDYSRSSILVSKNLRQKTISEFNPNLYEDNSRLGIQQSFSGQDKNYNNQANQSKLTGGFGKKDLNQENDAQFTSDKQKRQFKSQISSNQQFKHQGKHSMVATGKKIQSFQEQIQKTFKLPKDEKVTSQNSHENINLNVNNPESSRSRYSEKNNNEGSQLRSQVPLYDLQPSRSQKSQDTNFCVCEYIIKRFF